jgi:hypothetical protein
MPSDLSRALSLCTLYFVGDNAVVLEAEYQKKKSEEFFQTPSGTFLFTMTTVSMIGTCLMLEWLKHGHDSAHVLDRQPHSPLFWIIAINLVLLVIHRADFCWRCCYKGDTNARVNIWRWQILVLLAAVVVANLFFSELNHRWTERGFVAYDPALLTTRCDAVCGDLAAFEYTNWPNFVQEYPALLFISSFMSCRNSTTPRCAELGETAFDQQARLVTLLFSQLQRYAGTVSGIATVSLILVYPKCIGVQHPFSLLYAVAWFISTVIWFGLKEGAMPGSGLLSDFPYQVNRCTQ